jgi:hypothetical protein
MKKLRLRVESLAVDSFAPGDGEARTAPGTVHGQVRCTYWNTCLCESGPYWCGAPTFSCDYTGALCEP